MALTDASVTTAATALYDDLTSNGCQAVSNSNVLAFQQAFNAAGGSPSLATDGLYGANTSGALSQVIGANSGSTLGSYTAPSGCVSQGGGNGTTAVTVPLTDNVNFGYWPWILGGVVLVGGSYAAYAYSKKHKRGKRRR
jgi:hypothetical protein